MNPVHMASTKQIDISIIIVNYNLAKEIENCLYSLLSVFETSKQINYEIIIVDNNSPEKDLPHVEKKIKKDNIRYFYLDNNVGFGKGNNFGFSKATGEYICFLNPDTLVKKNIFSPIINLLENDISIGIIGPKQQVREPFFDFSAGFSPNVFFEVFNLFSAGVFLEGLLVRLYTTLRGKQPLEVNWILGAAIFIKSETFRSVNGFDKDYFMFFEEVDLCKRVADKGMKIIYYPELEIHHIGSVSGKKDYSLYTIRTYASKNIFLSKHFKLLKKYIMKSLLISQLFSQIIIWVILFLFNKQKSKQKLNAFFYLLKHNMKYEHRN